MAATAPDPLVYAFEDVRVDLRARRVTRGGAELALEPKAFAVLVVLLREAGAVVPRDALLDEVWGHRHVTPAVLNRVIAMLRRALGDDADHPRLIRTVYGTGYGFVGGVRRESIAAIDPVASTPDPIASGPAAPGSPPEATRPLRAPTTTTDAGVPRRTHVIRRLLVAAGLAALVAVAAWGWMRRGAEVVVQVPPAPATDTDAQANIPAPASRPPTAASPAPLRLAVLPLVADPPDADAVEIANGLTDGLIEMLSRQPRMAVLARESTERAAATGDRAAALRTLSADLLVGGRVTLDADGVVRVDIDLQGSAGQAWTRRYQRPRAQVFRLLGPLIDDLGSGLLPLDSEAGARALRASSARVQDLYWAAQQHVGRLAKDTAGEHGQRALAVLDELLALQPGFAPAHALRASVYTRLGVGGRIPLGEAAARATAAADRAIEIDPDLAEGHLARGFAATMQWRSIEALGPAQRALELAPNDYRALSLMGNVLAYLGRIGESEAYNARADALNPLLPWVMARNNWTAVLAGHKDQALADLRHVEAQQTSEARGGSAPRVRLAYGEPALALAATLPRRTDDAVMVRFVRATALQLLGDADAARAELASIAPNLPAMPMYADLLLRQALLDGTTATFAARLAAEPAPAQSPWREAFRATALAHAGDAPSALREFGRVFAEPRHRELLAYSWFGTHSGLSSIADWVALRRARGVPHAAELAAYEAFLDGFVHGGVRVPMLAYHRAVAAALRDDAAAADALLGEAIAAGWLDPVALRFDLAWAPYRDAAWFVQRANAIDARVRAERRAAGLPAD